VRGQGRSAALLPARSVSRARSLRGTVWVWPSLMCVLSLFSSSSSSLLCVCVCLVWVVPSSAEEPVHREDGLPQDYRRDAQAAVGAGGVAQTRGLAS
jgi:hypothetical protein